MWFISFMASWIFLPSFTAAGADDAKDLLIKEADVLTYANFELELSKRPHFVMFYIPK